MDYSEMMEMSRSLIACVDEFLNANTTLEFAIPLNLVPPINASKCPPNTDLQGTLDPDPVTVIAGGPSITIDIKPVIKVWKTLKRVLRNSRDMAYDILVLCQSLHDNENHLYAPGIPPLMRELMERMIDIAYIYQDVLNNHAENALENYIKHFTEYPRGSKFWPTTSKKRAERVEKGLHAYGLILGSDRQEIETGIKKFFDVFGGLLHGRLHSTKSKEIQISQAIGWTIISLYLILIIYYQFLEKPDTSEHLERYKEIVLILFKNEAVFE